MERPGNSKFPAERRKPRVVNTQFRLNTYLASERSERETIGSVQIRACAVYIYLITFILRNITSQLQFLSASAAGTSAIPVTDV